MASPFPGRCFIWAQLCDRSIRAQLATFCLLALATVSPTRSQPPDIFPEPFVIEHYVVQDDGDGSLYRSPTVKDHYGGSWIVSVRPDGSRMVVDLVRRTLTEILPAKGTYWTVTFDRYARLQNDLLDLEIGPRPDDVAPDAATLRAESELELRVVEPSARSIATLDGSIPGAATRAGVRHLRVDRADIPRSAALDVWVDPALRLTPRALDALEQFERQVTGSAAERLTGAPGPDRYVAAARRHAQGAMPVRTRRPLDMVPAADGATGPVEGPAKGTVEDVTVGWRRLEKLPTELLTVPAGFQRVLHPLELAIEALRFERAAERGRPR